MAVKVFAPAKVNLTLHVTGQRDDGYHLLDSLVAFADVGDWITITEAKELSLTVSGPQAEKVPVGSDNLVLRAARILSEGRGAHIHLEKILPVASGIGGGSADAGAVLRGLFTFWDVRNPTKGQADAMLALGADVPMCLASYPARIQGIGEQVSQLSPFPSVWYLLINPMVPVSTPQIFSQLKSHDNSPMPIDLPVFDTVDVLVEFLKGQRNDLEPVAISQVPQIDAVLEALKAEPGCMIARMSGSGATCFGLFENESRAKGAAQRINSRNGFWWIAGGSTYRDDLPMYPDLS